MTERTPWRITMNKKAMTRKPPNGPAFSEEDAQNADSMAVAFMHSYSGSCDNYVKYTLYDKEGNVIREKTTCIYEL